MIKYFILLNAICLPLGPVTLIPARADEPQTLELLQALGAKWELDPRGKVKSLDLSRTKFTPWQFQRICTLPRLEQLQLSQTKIDDYVLVHLRRLETLKSLDLSATCITNIGVWNLKELSRLEHLDLSKTEIDDRALATIRELKYLKSLNLAETGVTTYGVHHLHWLTRLESLNLDQTQVDDGILPALKQLKSLKVLHLTKTQVTDDAAREVRQALLSIKIYR